MSNVFELLATDEEVKTTTSYSIDEIWQKRNFLTGSASYKENVDMYVDITYKERNVGQVIEHTGIDSAAVEIRPSVTTVTTQKMAHTYYTHVCSAHDYNDLVRRYNRSLNGASRVNPADAIEVLKEWALSNYDSVVNKYVAACEKGLCQALSNTSGWIASSTANQEPISYNPNITNSFTGTLADFNATDPTLKLLEDIVLKSQTDGYSPDVIFVGDAVAKAILQSNWYITNSRTAPVSQAFNYTPKESSVLIRANGALELLGMSVGGCKVIWINSMVNGVLVFQPNCALALNSNDFASIYSGPTMADLGVYNDIIRFAVGPKLNEKEIRYFYEYTYLPVVNYPSEIYRIHYS
jgi:hypothetical protein